MSLDWRLDEIENHEKACWEEFEINEGGDTAFRLYPVTEALIWATMVVGMNRITEKNYEKFFARYCLSQMETKITLKDVKNHIGLRTNASTMSDTQFFKNQCDIIIRDGRAEMRRA